jgi:hypothetical protein
MRAVRCRSWWWSFNQRGGGRKRANPCPRACLRSPGRADVCAVFVLLLVTVVSSALEAPSGVGAPSLISSVDERWRIVISVFGSRAASSRLLPHESPELGVRILFDASRWYPCAEKQFRCQVLPIADACEIRSTGRAWHVARRARHENHALCNLPGSFRGPIVLLIGL